MPAHVLHIRIFFAVFLNDRINLVLDHIIIDHGIFIVMVVPVPGLLRVVMDKRSRLCVIIVMCHRMHQNLQPAPFSGGNRDRRDAQHLRQAVQVDLHTSFLDYIHHI